MKTILFSLLCLVSPAFCAQPIGGFWKTVNEDGVAQSIIAIYEYEGLYYGRIIGTFDPAGKMTDTIYHPVQRAPGVPNHPYYSGLDIIWYLEDVGSKFKGKILDPEKGGVYKSELWIDGSNLVVRGKLLFFGRSQEWLPVKNSDFPKGFKKPDLNTLVPVIPDVD